MSSASFVGLGIFFIIVSGMCMAFQTGVNSVLGSHVGRSLASVISFSLGLLVCAIFLCIDLEALHSPKPTIQDFKGECAVGACAVPVLWEGLASQQGNAS